MEKSINILLNLNEGSFPSSMAAREDPDVTEERRVAYVALTRPQERLVLHYRRPEDQSVNRKVQAISRFLDECGKGRAARTADRDGPAQPADESCGTVPRPRWRLGGRAGPGGGGARRNEQVSHDRR